MTTTYQYDALARRTGVTDPRTGTVATHYDPDTHRVDYVEDAGTNRTSYAYDGDTGRLASVTNALGNKTYYLYNARGQVTHTWGDVPQPVIYGYDAYGQRTTLTTFRDDGVDWTAAEWPSEPPEGDTTTWTYDEATGLVTAKRYADDKGPDYDYTADGKLAQRTWARQVGWPPEPLTTDYAYDPASGELTAIDYSDSTPDVSFTYTRTGAPATVIDVVGTRTFTYNAALQLKSESMGGASPMHTKVITRTYETGSGGTLAGRYNGVQAGPSNDPSADYSSSYYYDSLGRLNRLAGPATPGNWVNYLYLADSDIVEKIEYRGPATEGGYDFIASVIRTFEPNRDVIASVENKWNETSVSKFEYTNDALGRRTSVTVSGTAFTAAGTTGFDLYTYNDRNELASAKRYTGGTLENPSNPVYSRHFIYDYDPIGNRESYQIGQGTGTTYTANALNQYTQTADPSESFTHDDDGNLTQDGTYTYVWDGENRLIEIRPTSPGTNAIKFVYDYDYMGRRARRTQYGWTGSAWSTSIADQRIYLYDRWNNLIIYDADNGMAIGRKLTWGLDLSGLNGGASPSPVDPNRDREGAAIPGMHAAGGIGGLVAAWAPASPAKQYFCFYDANGNLSDCLKNSDGTRWSHFEYDPYGGLIVASDAGGLGHPFRYSTKFYQAAFAIYAFGYRVFIPRHGRWCSRDTILEQGNYRVREIDANLPQFVRFDPSLSCVNRFAYLYNSPFYWIDPDGCLPQQASRESATQPASQPKPNPLKVGTYVCSDDEKGFFDELVKRRLSTAVRAASGKEILDALANKCPKPEDCIDTWIHAQHGWLPDSEYGKAVEGGFGGGQSGSGTGMYGRDPVPQSDDGGRRKGGRSLIDLKEAIKSGKITFCDSCEIYVYGCEVSNTGTFAGKLSSITGCTVYAASGKCSTAHSDGTPGTARDPWRAEGCWEKWRDGKKDATPPTGKKYIEPPLGISK